MQVITSIATLTASTTKALRYFVGFTLEETAEIVGISVPTAKRWWTYA